MAANPDSLPAAALAATLQALHAPAPALHMTVRMPVSTQESPTLPPQKFAQNNPRSRFSQMPADYGLLHSTHNSLGQEILCTLCIWLLAAIRAPLRAAEAPARQHGPPASNQTRAHGCLAAAAVAAAPLLLVPVLLPTEPSFIEASEELLSLRLGCELELDRGWLAAARVTALPPADDEAGRLLLPPTGAGKGSCSPVASWPSSTNRMGRQRLSSCIRDEFCDATQQQRGYFELGAFK